jgi:hypothetical protein
VVVDKKSKRIICTAFTNGKCHDFRLFKKSKTYINPKIRAITDTGYQGLKKIHANSDLPKKKTKKSPLTQEDKKKNQKLASERVINENVIGSIKRFKIISDRYRNRRKRFTLRFNLIAGIYNWELDN